jgi:hypothetical protein
MTLNTAAHAFSIQVLDTIPADTLLTRPQTAKALTDCGVPTAEKTLSTKASRGGGPPYRLYGKIAIYTWGDVVAWVREIMGESASNATERHARDGTPAPSKPSPEKLAAMVDGSRRYNAARVAARKASATLRSEEPRGPPGEAAASKTE